MDILITGGTGFIGQHLCRTLSQKGHRLIALAVVCPSGLAGEPQHPVALWKHRTLRKMKFSAIGLDIAKSVFHGYGITEDGEIMEKELRRPQVLDYFANLEVGMIGVESCGSAHYWARELMKLGQVVKLNQPASGKTVCEGQ